MMSTFARLMSSLFALLFLFLPSTVWAQEKIEQTETTTSDPPKEDTTHNQYVVPKMSESQMEHVINSKRSWYIEDNWFSYARASIGTIFFTTADAPPLFLMAEFSLSYQFTDAVEASVGLGAGTHATFIDDVTSYPFLFEFFAEGVLEDWAVVGINYMFLQHWIQRDEDGEKIPGISLGEVYGGIRYRTDGKNGFETRLTCGLAMISEHRDRFGLKCNAGFGGYWDW